MAASTTVVVEAVAPLAVSAQTAAEMLDLSVDTIERLVRDGHLHRIPHVSVIRITIESLTAFANGKAVA